MPRMKRRRIFSPLRRLLLAALYGGFATKILAQKQFRQLSRLPLESQSLLSQHQGYKDKRVSEAYIWTFAFLYQESNILELKLSVIRFYFISF